MNQRKTLAKQFEIASPAIFATLLFFLLFSGPPSLRLRNLEDSLEGIIDTSVEIQVSVWIVAGLWTIHQIYKRLRNRSLVGLGVPHKLGLAMICFLGLSSCVSDAPMLTAFKAGQMLVALLFTWIFVQRFGIAKCIDYIFLCSTVLCIAIAVSAFVAPDLVLFLDEGRMRLRGDPIAVMGIVGTYSTILLFVKRRKLSTVIFWTLLMMLCGLLAFSLTRQAWFLVIGFLILKFARQSKGTLVRRLGLMSLILFPVVFVVYILPALQEYRDTDSIWSLTGRTDLWIHLVQVVFDRSAWTGLGYYSASRILGPEFNPGMGTAHSMLVEVLLGGGLLSLLPCLVMCFLLSRYAFKLLGKGRSELEFTCGALFFVTLALGLMGADFGFSQVGIAFWSFATALPGFKLAQSIPQPVGPPQKRIRSASRHPGLSLPGTARLETP